MITRGNLDFEAHFTTMPNAWARDARLSRRARGLLVELLSHRVGWTVSVASLVAAGPEGRDAIRAAIRELIEYGYLVREQGHDESGKFAEADYMLTNPERFPLSEPATEKPTSVYPTSANPHPKKTIVKKTSLKNNGDASAADSLPLDLPKQTGSKAPDGYTSEFLDFWKHYPSTANKRGAFKAYKAALKDHTADQLLAYLQRWVSSRKLAASRKEFVPHAPHAATWLNQRRWEDLDEQQQGGRISQAIEQQQTASSPVDLTREDVDRILGQDYWVAPDPPEAVRGDLRAERDWTRQLAAEHAKARQIEAQRRLAAL